MIPKVAPLIAALILTGVSAPSESDPLSELMAEPASKYDLGLLRLSVAINGWSGAYREQPGIKVLMSRNKQGGIDFYLDPSFPLRDAKTSAQAESICRQIGQNFLSMILGNAGDPTQENIRGENIYLIAWGAYFASTGDTDSHIQEIGKAVSTGSIVRVSTGRRDFKECTYVSGGSYKRVPYT